MGRLVVDVDGACAHPRTSGAWRAGVDVIHVSHAGSDGGRWRCGLTRARRQGGRALAQRCLFGSAPALRLYQPLQRWGAAARADAIIATSEPLRAVVALALPPLEGQDRP